MENRFHRSIFWFEPSLKKSIVFFLALLPLLLLVIAVLCDTHALFKLSWVLKRNAWFIVITIVYSKGQLYKGWISYQLSFVRNSNKRLYLFTFKEIQASLRSAVYCIWIKDILNTKSLFDNIHFKEQYITL